VWPKVASVNDVAAAILERTGPLDTFKLQKLTYYCQAWHLVWDSEPLFLEPIEAWAGGPVVRALYDQHRARYTVSDWPTGNASALTQSQRETVDAVVEGYGHLSGRQLSLLTHREAPWRDARHGLAPGDRGTRVIEPAAMQDYYLWLDQSEDAEPVAEMDR
jgi:uncharacterized phage-associated protein